MSTTAAATHLSQRRVGHGYKNQGKQQFPVRRRGQLLLQQLADQGVVLSPEAAQAA
jgi:hypothetical protein